MMIKVNAAGLIRPARPPNGKTIKIKWKRQGGAAIAAPDTSKYSRMEKIKNIGGNL
jgi:hypothetical protein